MFFGILTAQRPAVPPYLISAVISLDAQVERMPELFSAPSPRLQTEILSSAQTNESARAIISTLYEHQNALPEIAIQRAALLAYALEDYKRAAGFVDTGLKAFPSNEQLLAARGLIEYEQSFYTQSLSRFQKAVLSAPSEDSRFRAAVFGNEGLVHWELGQTSNAEISLNKSLALFDADKAQPYRTYFLLTQASLYADYGEERKASEIAGEALSLLKSESLDNHTGADEGSVVRLRAELALFRGLINEAKQGVAEAIQIHQNGSNLLELAQDLDVRADIEEQTGRHEEAYRTLLEAAELYLKISYVKGRSGNQLKQAKVLIDLDKFEEAEKLINDASIGFDQLNYKRGSGECEVMTGVLILRRANHEYIKRFHQDMPAQEEKKISEEFLTQARPGIEYFERAISVFQELSYKRGIASAQDKLAINLLLLTKGKESSEEEISQAIQYDQGAAKIYEEIGNKRGQAEAYGNLGIILRVHHQYDDAITNLEKALQICRDIDFRLGIGRQFLNLGRVYYDKGFSEKKEQLLQTARNYFLEAQKEFSETQSGHDELEIIDKYLKNLAGILR